MTASDDDVTDSLETDELLEDDGPIFPACGRLTFSHCCSERDLELPDEENSSRGESTTSSQRGSFSCGQDEGRRQQAEGFEMVDPAGDTIPLHIIPKIIGAAIIGDIKQHVEYTILLSGSEVNSADRAFRRRYSEFSSLHDSLLKTYASHMAGLFLPPKVWFGNFSPEVIEKRRLALQAYLGSVVDNIVLRQSHPFVIFCSRREICEASDMTRAAHYEKAHSLFEKALISQSLLLGCSHLIVVETCCYLAAVLFERGLLEEAAQYSEMALTVLERDDYRQSVCLLPPLVRLMIKVYKYLNRIIDATRLELWLGQLTTSAHEKSLLQLAAAKILLES